MPQDETKTTSPKAVTANRVHGFDEHFSRLVGVGSIIYGMLSTLNSSAGYVEAFRAESLSYLFLGMFAILIGVSFLLISLKYALNTNEGNLDRAFRSSFKWTFFYLAVVMAILFGCMLYL